ncbi:MAG TPA: tripartite tricarboxylate transporter substrate binding protein [Burkholderiales bacterium]|nr:tripartite tricarboxylate transporter substrate binding protein [Burkholderiales bacterium]
MTRTTRVIALAACIALSVSAGAQTFPERPVQIITPYAAGGGLDIITRTLAQKLTTQWGKQVLVDNKPGAGSTLGTALAAKAPKDGHTLLVASTPLGVAPAVYPSLTYDARRDFAPLSLVATTPEVLVVTPTLGVASVAELVTRAKSRPQNYGSAGSGTLGHLAADSVNRRLGLGATHIPYKGSNPATIDLIGGQIDWMMDTPSAVLPHVRAGKLRALAIAAPQRSPQLPEVPTLAEAGYPELEFRIWMGLMAPAGTPEPVLKTIEAAVAEAMRDPALRAALTAQGWDIVGLGSREFAAFLDKELPKLTAAAKAAGVKAD